jgi:glycosyltransferase involved in cell wall biosynthesis
VVHGEVEDASAFMAQCDLLIMPLRMGSGLKIKALEAIWLGIPLLSTTLGVQGLGLRPRLDYWPAENPADFLEGLQRLHAEPELLDQMRQNALQTLKNHLQPDLQLKSLSALLQPLTSA